MPKRIVLGNLEGAVGKEKEWTDCVQSDIRVFCIAGDWEATALEAEVFAVAWIKEEVDAARLRQEKRE